MTLSPARTRLVITLALTILTLAVYGQIVGHGFIELDDLTYITSNPPVTKGLTLDSLRWAFTATHTGNWHPITWISHMLDVSIFGLQPAGHHAVNLILHLANTLLLFQLLRLATGAEWRSAMVAALFAIHPLHVESVAWAAERKDVLSTLLLLLTLLAYHRYTLTNRVHTYLLALFCFMLGLMAKSMLVSVPLILLLLDYWPLRRFASPAAAGATPQLRRIVLEKLPFIAISALFCIVTIYSQSAGRAVSHDAALTATIRIQNAVRAYGSYLLDTLVPTGLAPFYPLIVPIPLTPVLLSALTLVAITLLAWKVRRQAPYVAMGWLWFLVTLVPTIGLIQVGLQSHADRYTYIPLLGVFVALTWGLADLALARQFPRRPLAIIAGTALLILSLLCFRQAGYWRDSGTLFRHTMAVTDRNYLAAMILGNHYLSKRDFNQAIHHYQLGINFGSNASVLHLLHTQLATCYGIYGQYDRAIHHYHQALIASPQDKQQDATTYLLMAEMMVAKGTPEAAIPYLHRSLASKPDQSEAHFSLAQILIRQGDLTGALPHYQAVLNHHPDNADALYAMGLDAIRRNDRAAAVANFSKALQSRPTFVDARRKLEQLQAPLPPVAR